MGRWNKAGFMVMALGGEILFTPEISVIMLTYNREQLVGRAIESIHNQTFRNFEFIIVDNGSTDGSGKIADKYAAKDTRIHVIHKEKGNIGSGRNTGLNAAIGSYIAFIDDDDYAEPDFLEFLYNLAFDNDVDIAICGADDKAFDDKLVMNAETAISKLLWRKWFNVQFPTKLIHSSLFDGVRFSETSKYDDIELMPRILARAKRVAYHGLPKYKFYRHEGNNSAWTTNHELLNADTLNEYLQVYDERTKWLCELFPDNSAYWKYFEWSFMLSMVEKITRLELHDCGGLKGEMEQKLKTNIDSFLTCPWILDFETRWLNDLIIIGR